MKRRYIVECQVPFVREIRVGIDADSEEDALWMARELMESPEELHTDNPLFPVIRDALEESDGSRVACRIHERLEPHQEWPLPDPSVDTLRRRQFATKAALLLVEALSGHEAELEQTLLDQAHALALRATGGLDGETAAHENRVVIATEGGVIQSIVAEDPFSLRIAEIDYTRDNLDGPFIVEHAVEASGLEMDEVFAQASRPGQLRKTG